jgi:hypothetical protein
LKRRQFIRPVATNGSFPAMARAIALLISVTLLGLSLGRFVYHATRLSEPYARSVML